MKKLSMIMAIVLLLTMFATPFAHADETFEVKGIEYDGMVLKGEVSTPEGEYFARITMFLNGGQYIVLVEKLVDNSFNVHIFADCVYVTVGIVDRFDAFIPGTYTAYAAMGKEL